MVHAIGRAPDRAEIGRARLAGRAIQGNPRPAQTLNDSPGVIGQIIDAPDRYAMGAALDETAARRRGINGIAQGGEGSGISGTADAFAYCGDDSAGVAQVVVRAQYVNRPIVARIFGDDIAAVGNLVVAVRLNGRTERGINIAAIGNCAVVVAQNAYRRRAGGSDGAVVDKPVVGGASDDPDTVRRGGGDGTGRGDGQVIIAVKLAARQAVGDGCRGVNGKIRGPGLEPGGKHLRRQQQGRGME